MDTKNLPTKNNLIKIKRTIQQSKEGQMLLEQKKMILQKELDKNKEEAKKLKLRGSKILEKAYHALKIANVEIGIEDMIAISDGIKIDCKIDVKYKTIMGVEVPSVVFPEEEKQRIPYGLYNTTFSVDEAILGFMEVKKYLLELAQIENRIFRLERNIEKVQRRSNALKEIIIPADEKVAKQIQEILDENEKEELIRLKKLKGKRENTNVKK